jgi:hypothetical protein
VTAIAQRRRRRTIAGLLGTVLLMVAAGVMFAVGVITLSNSEEGEAVGIDDRPVSALPATPNALLAVTDEDGALSSVAVVTLLPSGRGGSIVTMPVTADATGAFGAERRPLREMFDADDADAFTSMVEEMLSITIQHAQVVDAAGLGELTVAASVEVVDPVDDQFWVELAAAAPVGDDPADVPLDEFGQPSTPADVAELVDRLLAGEVQSRMLVTRAATAEENPDGVDVVVIDRQDANLVFAQVSPSLVSTPNTGLTLRVVAPFSDDQIAASDGRYGSSSDVMLDVIGEMLFFQANVVSVDTQAAAEGAGPITRIEVNDESLVDDMESIAPLVFGESEVVVATSLIEGVDAVVTLGTDYVTTKRERPSAASTTVSSEPTTVSSEPTTVPGDTVDPDE